MQHQQLPEKKRYLKRQITPNPVLLFHAGGNTTGFQQTLKEAIGMGQSMKEMSYALKAASNHSH